MSPWELVCDCIRGLSLEFGPRDTIVPRDFASHVCILQHLWMEKTALLYFEKHPHVCRAPGHQVLSI